MGYKIQRKFQDLGFQIYEKHSDVGGTWYENRYPGCVCDNPSHTYVWVCFCPTVNMLDSKSLKAIPCMQSFDPNPSWSSTYASSTEIFECFKRFQFRFNLGDRTQAAHQVIGARWDEQDSKWHVEIKGRPQ